MQKMQHDQSMYKRVKEQVQKQLFMHYMTFTNNMKPKPWF